MSFPNTIYGQSGWEKVQTSTQKHKIGTRMTFDDGRVFRYSEVGGVNIAAGAVVQAPAAVAHHDVDLAITTAASGVTEVTVTLENTATTLNQYKDGYLFINDGVTGEGHVYKIKSNPVASGNATCAITLYEDDPTITALTNGTHIAGLVVNPYSNVIISPTTVTNMAIGVAPRLLTTEYFGWLQTWGPASVLAIAAGVVGQHIRVGGSGTAGGTNPLDRDGSAEDEQAIGVQMQIAPTSAGDYGLVYLTITP